MNEIVLGCVVMAAGNATRFDGNKLAAELFGKPIAAHVLDAIPGSLFSRVVVVSQYREIAEMAHAHEFLSIHNEHPDYGISHTIELGLSELMDCDGVLFCVSDQPMLRGDTIQRIVERFLESPACIVAAAHAGTRGNPCLFPKEFYPELLALREDHGGNTVIRRHEDRLLLVETDELELTDCDTKTALDDLKKNLE